MKLRELYSGNLMQALSEQQFKEIEILLSGDTARNIHMKMKDIGDKYMRRTQFVSTFINFLTSILGHF